MQTLFERYKPLWAPEGAAGGSSAPGAPSGGGGSAPSSGASAPSSAPSSPSGSPASRSATTPGGSPASAREAQPSSDDTFSGDFSFDSIFSDDVDRSPPPSGDEAPPAAPPTVPTQPTVPPAAAAPAAETPVAPGSAPVEAAAAQVAPGAGPPQEQPSAAPLDPYNPGQLASHLAGGEAEAVNFVAEQMFALTPEDKEAIETDVIAHIPKMLARVFVKSQQNVLQQLDRLIPVMVQRHTEAMKRNSVGEDKFYDRWKNIGREHSELVNRYATVYRQMHPAATLEQMIELVGPMVMMAANIAPQLPGGAGVEQPAATRAAPAAGGRPPQPTPFVPAGSGSGPASQPKTQELNPWEAMFVGRE